MGREFWFLILLLESDKKKEYTMIGDRITLCFSLGGGMEMKDLCMSGS